MQDLPIRNLVDVMHCEKNLGENILKTIFGEKDSPKVRLDLQNRGIRRHLWLRMVREQRNRAFMPNAEYVLSKESREKFLANLKGIKLPSDYCSSLHSKVSKGKLTGLKSHDYHVLIQDLLPVCMRDLGCDALTSVIVRISRIFNKICLKTVDSAERETLFEECSKTLCLMEKMFPPSFFDVMVHLTIHLVEELFICGPVHIRWMYPYERYFKTLKGYVRNTAKPEGCMAKGYELLEACGFVSEYFGDGHDYMKKIWDSEEDPSMTDIVLEGKGKDRELDETLWRDMHTFVVDNADITEDYRE